MLIATAGHVDHGKTALVHALTGVDTDRLPEEKARGLTIDLGFAYRRLEDATRLAFVDVPGHEKFIRNMIAGVPAVDFALLIVAADDGVMPQTREHLSILDLLAVPRGFVVMTKIDRVDAARREEVTHDIEDLIAGSCLDGAPLHAVSALEGEGVEQLAEALADAARDLPQRDDAGAFRLAVDRVFSPPGEGLVVTGAVYNGRVQVGDELTLVPGGDTVRVRAIEMASEIVDTAGTGERCALSLSGRGVGTSNLRRGQWLVAQESLQLTQRVDARLRLLDSEPRALKPWSSVHAHHGADFLAARVSSLRGAPVAPGEEALVQLVLERPTGVFHGDLLLLRDPSGRRTMGSVRVIDPFAPRRVQDRAGRLALIGELETTDARSALKSALDREPQGVDIARFAQSRNVPENVLRSAAEELGARMLMLRDGRRYFSSERVERLGAMLTDALTDFHEKEPQRLGPQRDELVRTCVGQAPMPVLVALLEALIAEGRIVRDGASHRLPSHEVRLSGVDARRLDALRKHLTPTTLKAPSVGELAERMKMDRDVLLAFLKQCERRGQVVRVADNRYFDAQAVAALARTAQELAEKGEAGRFDAKLFRDASGIGRNLTIDVLEYFDRKGFTRRLGDERVVVKRAERLFG